MSISRSIAKVGARAVRITMPVLLAAFSLAGCHSPSSSADDLAKERVAIVGSKPPADAGAKYLSSHGNDPAAIRAKIDAAGAAFQNQKK